MPAAATGVGGIDLGRGVSKFKIPKPGEKSPGFLFSFWPRNQRLRPGFFTFPVFEC
jgi:hypothetical protein